jgi:hypothetical protein
MGKVQTWKRRTACTEKHEKHYNFCRAISREIEFDIVGASTLLDLETYYSYAHAHTMSIFWHGYSYAMHKHKHSVTAPI